MDTITGPLGEWLADRIPKLASTAHRRFPMVPKKDFEQEIWLRALSEKSKLAGFLRDDREGLLWSELWKAATRLGNEDDRYRRACKARAAGYKVWDEQFYSGKTLAALVTILVQNEGDPAEAVYTATRRMDAGIYMRPELTDPTRLETFMAALIDVNEALSRLSKGDRKTLEAWYGIGYEDDDKDTDEIRWERRKLASSMGITYEAFKQRAYRARRKLQWELGGEDPWRKQDREAA